MGLRTSAIIILLVLSFLTGCGKSNYILISQAPEELNGFLGFRWAVPMDIVDNYLAELTNAQPAFSYNDFYTSSYSNIYFMGRKAGLCRFNFDNAGLKLTTLEFLSTRSYSYSDLEYFRDKLTEVYGIPVQMTRPAYKEEYINYIEGYYWFQGRLSLTLMPGEVIVIRAYRDNCTPPDTPPPPPPINITRKFLPSHARGTIDN